MIRRTSHLQYSCCINQCQRELSATGLLLRAELAGASGTAVLCQEEVTSEELRLDAKASSRQLFAKASGKGAELQLLPVVDVL